MAYAFVIGLSVPVLVSGVIIAVRGRTPIAIATGSAAIWLGVFLTEMWGSFFTWPMWALTFACFWAFRAAAMATGTLRHSPDRNRPMMALAIAGIVLGVALLALLGYGLYGFRFLGN